MRGINSDASGLPRPNRQPGTEDGRDDENGAQCIRDGEGVGFEIVGIVAGSSKRQRRKKSHGKRCSGRETGEREHHPEPGEILPR